MQRQCDRQSLQATNPGGKSRISHNVAASRPRDTGRSKRRARGDTDGEADGGASHDE